jgi:sporulation protein YlmC with PRC-barrel domain
MCMTAGALARRRDDVTEDRAMRGSRRREASILAAAVAAATFLGTAEAATPSADRNTQIFVHAASALPHFLRVAARDMAALYSRAHALIGSLVLNLDGERIGQVESLVLDEGGRVREVLISLNDGFDSDGGPIAVSPHRAEVISTNGSHVSVIRIDLTREELVQAQLVGLKSDARAPAERGAGEPEIHRDIQLLF